MHIAFTELSLPLVHTFTIARSSETTARTAILRVAWRGLEGLGETAPSA
ncbi:MAG: dipeptide epimerase, partial [Candidatus Eremiobacteraeota bacterium]|nr:dipeptide epimerase [Candidatus Eremiobacteraeota bacterium]